MSVIATLAASCANAHALAGVIVENFWFLGTAVTLILIYGLALIMERRRSLLGRGAESRCAPA
jgi:hypothetical protein